MPWVGITGKMGAGKDHLFKAMAHRDSRFERASFADQLRVDIETTLDSHLPPLWTKPYPEEIRRLTQWWGTDLRRAKDPDYWVRKGEEYAANVELGGGIPVFTDVRFPNEADMIRSHGGFIVRVRAPHDVRERRLGMIPPNHESENAMDDYPYIPPSYEIMSDGEYLESYNMHVARIVRDAVGTG